MELRANSRDERNEWMAALMNSTHFTQEVSEGKGERARVKVNVNVTVSVTMT